MLGSIKDARRSAKSNVIMRYSIMTTRSDSNTLFEKCVYLMFLIAVVNAASEVCDQSKCPGPIKYYENLGCTPVYENPGDCCAVEYNCDHLKNRSKKKCYVNNNVYNIGDRLKDEDKNPCDIGCTCTERPSGIAGFSCAIVDCFHGPITPGCYRKMSPDRCCSNEEVCPEKPEDRAICVVNGKTYYDGEYFQVESEPDKTCYCMPGYEGKNIEPFCKKPNRPYCTPEFRNANNIYENCAPVYYDNQSPQTDCSVFSRCQNKNDTVIHNHDQSKSNSNSNSNESGEEKVCVFGNMKMHLGDELNQSTSYESVCVKCVCEVPPLPTCQRLPSSECDITKHPIFD